MAEIDLGKVSLTFIEQWSPTAAIERLTCVPYGGGAWVSLINNQGVEPGTDAAVWMEIARAGKSLYEILHDAGVFEGTEQQFIDHYLAVLDNAKKAASEAWNSAHNVREQLQSYVSEFNKWSGVMSGYEKTMADMQKQEQSRQDAEKKRSDAESQRIDNDSARAAKMQEIVQENERQLQKMTTATQLSEQATVNANNAANTANTAAKGADESAANADEAAKRTKEIGDSVEGRIDEIEKEVANNTLGLIFDDETGVVSAVVGEKATNFDSARIDDVTGEVEVDYVVD